MIKRFFYAILLILAFPAFLAAQNSAEEIQTLRQERTDILRFGIDSEVITLISTLETEKNPEFNELILRQAATSVNQDLLAGAFNLFNTLDYRDAEDLAVKILGDYDLYRSNLVVGVLAYLKKDMTPELAEAVVPLLRNTNAAIVRGAVDALGAVKDEKYAGVLMDLFGDPDFPEENKTTVLISLGDMGYQSAAEMLTEIALDDQERAAWRWYAAQSLGKIGLPESFDVLRSLLGDPDPNLRSYVVEALGNYKTPQAEEVLIAALRDSFWRVRVSAARQLGDRESPQAVEILIYKAKSDPENNVRREAITALGKIGSKDGFDFLRELAGKKTTNPAIWLQAASTLAEKDLKDSLPVFEKLISDDWGEDNSYFLNNLAKLLSEKDDAPYLGEIFRRFMDHKNMVIKIYGIRGAERNGLSQYRERITELSEEGNPRSVRQAALGALEKL